jgi:hypothetical protein
MTTVNRAPTPNMPKGPLFLLYATAGDYVNLFVKFVLTVLVLRN